MLGTGYGPVPIDPREQIEIVTGLDVTEDDQQKMLWRNAARFFSLEIS